MGAHGGIEENLCSAVRIGLALTTGPGGVDPDFHSLYISTRLLRSGVISLSPRRPEFIAVHKVTQELEIQQLDRGCCGECGPLQVENSPTLTCKHECLSG